MKTIISMNLEWQETTSTGLHYKDAQLLQKDGWRIPNLRELSEAYQMRVPGFFPSYYWTSTSFGYSNYVHGVNFKDGSVGPGMIGYNGFYLRLCREVQ